MVLIVEDSSGVGGAEGCHLFFAACKGSQRKVFYPAPPTTDTCFTVEMLLKFAFMFFLIFCFFQFPVLQDNLEVYLGLQQVIVTSGSGKLSFIF